jgi:predicted nucleic acid-binding protein
LNGYGQPLMLDHSVWARVLDQRLASRHRNKFDAALAAGELWACPPTLLEMRYSAHDERSFRMLAERLDALPRASLTAEAARLALDAQSELASAKGISHRVKPVDLLIASIASAQNLGVLHYDHDYDTIEQHTSLSFPSVWVAPRGGID